MLQTLKYNAKRLTPFHFVTAAAQQAATGDNLFTETEVRGPNLYRGNKEKKGSSARSAN